MENRTNRPTAPVLPWHKLVMQLSSSKRTIAVVYFFIHFFNFKSCLFKSLYYAIILNNEASEFKCVK